MSGDREKDVRRVVSVMNEIGVGGLNLEVVMDNEASLQSLVNAALMKSNCRSFHPRHVAVARPQAKRLERFVGICREGVFANWLALQEHLKVRLALEAPVLGYLIGHVYRTYNAFQSREGGTPLERLRGVRGSQTPRTFSLWSDRFCEAGASFELARAAIDRWSVSRAKVLFRWRLSCVSVGHRRAR